MIGDSGESGGLAGKEPESKMARSSGGPSAAQNGTVIQTCSQCGAVNEGQEDFCCFCDSRLTPKNEVSLTTEVSPGNGSVLRPRSKGALALSTVAAPGLDDADWRREVASRLEAYRSRRRRQRPDDLQTALPFGAEGEAPFEEDSFPPPVQPPETIERVERMEITAAPSAEEAQDDWPSTAWQREEAPGDAAMRPVADLGERQRAGLLDGAFLVLAYGAFLGVFKAFGGELKFGKLDVMVHAAAMVAFYAQYFTLFTVLGRGTPGILIRGLEVLSFDGGAPTRTQLVWRSFGYLVSAATLFLGFCWALWDEDRLTWQDRISQTYITPAGEEEFELETHA